MTEQIVYMPIFGLTTVIMGWVTGIGMGMLFLEMALKQTYWSSIMAVPMIGLWWYLLRRDEKNWMKK